MVYKRVLLLRGTMQRMSEALLTYSQCRLTGSLVASGKRIEKDEAARIKQLLWVYNYSSASKAKAAKSMFRPTSTRNVEDSNGDSIWFSI